MMSEVIAETKNGKVRGSIQKGLEHCEFYAFKGIPYAKPPVGQLRFRDPEPAEPWSGVRDATNFGSCCAQFDFLSNEIKGDDDCLYLNVYTKDMTFRTGRPVIVWIHAGLFLIGSGDDWFYGPDYFLRKDVVFVTLNYRLGVFGFLNLDDEAATGNQGLKDQVMALKWVRDNIANFGGDPDNVTIAGNSAGSASSHYLAISPLAEGLFHKVICQSGVALNPWALDANPKERAYRLCELLGHSDKEPKSIVEFLRTIDAQQLAVTEDKTRMIEERIRFSYIFGPSIDSKSKTPFMPVHPEIAAAKGIRVPLIIGHTNAESTFFKKDLSQALNRFDKEIDETLHPEAVRMIKSVYNMTPQTLKRIYFDSKSITENNLETLIDYHGDLYFVEGIHRVVKIQVEKSCSPTYLYQFSHGKKSPELKLSTNSNKNRKDEKLLVTSAGHGRELQYLFKMQYFSGKSRNEEIHAEQCRITEQIIELWVNFATTGIPSQETSDLIPIIWQPVDSTTIFNYLNIGEELRMGTVLSLDQSYVKHGRCDEGSIAVSQK